MSDEPRAVRLQALNDAWQAVAGVADNHHPMGWLAAAIPTVDALNAIHELRKPLMADQDEEDER